MLYVLVLDWNSAAPRGRRYTIDVMAWTRRPDTFNNECYVHKTYLIERVNLRGYECYNKWASVRVEHHMIYWQKKERLPKKIMYTLSRSYPVLTLWCTSCSAAIVLSSHICPSCISAHFPAFEPLYWAPTDAHHPSQPTFPCLSPGGSTMDS